MRLLKLKNMQKKIFIVLLVFISFYTFSQNKSIDTTIIVNKIKVNIVKSENSIGNILMLPGWNFSRTDCCEKSNFCKKALAEGYCLIMPEMGKSIYQWENFKETRKDWLQYPTLKWLLNEMIPFIQNKFNILKSTQKNFVYGISTGARGVAMIALKSNLFICGVALSGDYDQTFDTNDNLMKGYYGRWYLQKERWKNIDNPTTNRNNIKFSIVLFHGEKDKVAPSWQSKYFYEKIKNNNLKLKHDLILIKNAEHNYTFWSSQTDTILKIFNKKLK